MWASDSNLDIIGISETWLDGDIAEVEVAIAGFRCYRKDREQVKTGKNGGVLMYVQDDITPCAYRELNQYKAESMWCKIVADKGKEIVLGVCYRSPTAGEAETEELFKVMRMAAEKEALIMGDFNYPGIKWETLESDRNGIAFRDLVLDSFLVQHVHSPTREHNILDLVLSTSEAMVEHLVIQDHLGNSDHNSVWWELICSTWREGKDKMQRKYFKGNYDAMREDLVTVKWEEEFQNMDVEAMWQRFRELLDLEMDKCVPSEKVRKRTYPK
jgi:hypothetical protein